MFKVDRIGPNRVDITFGGSLDSAEMKQALDDLVDKTKDIEHGRMLYRVDDFALPTLGAIGVELARLPALFSLIGKFDRAAVLADQTWVKSWSQFKGTLIPGLDIKAFDRNQEAQAESWLNS